MSSAADAVAVQFPFSSAEQHCLLSRVPACHRCLFPELEAAVLTGSYAHYNLGNSKAFLRVATDSVVALLATSAPRLRHLLLTSSVEWHIQDVLPHLHSLHALTTCATLCSVAHSLCPRHCCPSSTLYASLFCSALSREQRTSACSAMQTTGSCRVSPSTRTRTRRRPTFSISGLLHGGQVA